MHHLAFGSKFQILHGLFGGKPTRLIDLVIMVTHIALQVAQQKKINTFVNLNRFSIFGFVAVGITNITEFPDDPALESGLFTHFAQRRLLDPLAFLDMALGQSPTVAYMNQGDFNIVGMLAINYTAGRDLSNRAYIVAAGAGSGRQLVL